MLSLSEPEDEHAVDDLEARSDMVFKGSHVAHWQDKLSKRHSFKFSFSQLVNCTLHCGPGDAEHFPDVPVPTSLPDWTDESILPQHSLLNLLNVDKVSVLDALRHAHTVCSTSKSSVTVVLSHAQHYRARSVNLTDGWTKIGHLDRGAPLFRSADPKQKVATSAVSVLHVAHKSLQQLNVVAKQKLKMLFDGLAGGKSNLQPARLLMDTGAEACFLSAEFAKRCNLSIREGPKQAASLATGSVVTMHKTAQISIKIGALLHKRLDCHVIPMSAAYDVILGESWLAAGKAMLQYTEEGAAVRLSKGQKTVLLRQAQCTAARVQSKSHRCREPIGLSSMLMAADDIEHEMRSGTGFLVRVLDKQLASVSTSAQAAVS